MKKYVRKEGFTFGPILEEEKEQPPKDKAGEPPPPETPLEVDKEGEFSIEEWIKNQGIKMTPCAEPSSYILEVPKVNLYLIVDGDNPAVQGAWQLIQSILSARDKIEIDHGVNFIDLLNNGNINFSLTIFHIDGQDYSPLIINPEGNIVSCSPSGLEGENLLKLLKKGETSEEEKPDKRRLEFEEWAGKNNIKFTFNKNGWYELSVESSGTALVVYKTDKDLDVIQAAHAQLNEIIKVGGNKIYFFSSCFIGTPNGIDKDSCWKITLNGKQYRKIGVDKDNKITHIESDEDDEVQELKGRNLLDLLQSEVLREGLFSSDKPVGDKTGEKPEPVKQESAAETASELSLLQRMKRGLGFGGKVEVAKGKEPEVTITLEDVYREIKETRKEMATKEELNQLRGEIKSELNQVRSSITAIWVSMIGFIVSLAAILCAKPLAIYLKKFLTRKKIKKQ